MNILLQKILHISLLLILASLLLHGCARHHPPRHPPQEPIRPEQEQIIRPEPEQRQETIQEEDIKPSQPGSMPQEHKERFDPELKPQKGPAQALFRDAEQAVQKGEYKRAEMLLERAVRVEPRNGWYWHMMGRVQYEQGSFDQAIQFCLKSNSLAGGDADLKRNNKLLLERAKKKRGE
jgi:predicted Zn-dependent protease